MKWVRDCVSAKKGWPWAILSGLISQVSLSSAFQQQVEVEFIPDYAGVIKSHKGKCVQKGSSGVKMSDFWWKDMTVWYIGLISVPAPWWYDNTVKMCRASGNKSNYRQV